MSTFFSLSKLPSQGPSGAIGMPGGPGDRGRDAKKNAVKYIFSVKPAKDHLFDITSTTMPTPPTPPGTEPPPEPPHPPNDQAYNADTQPPQPPEPPENWEKPPDIPFAFGIPASKKARGPNPRRDLIVDANDPNGAMKGTGDLDDAGMRKHLQGEALEAWKREQKWEEEKKNMKGWEDPKKNATANGTPEGKETNEDKLFLTGLTPQEAEEGQVNAATTKVPSLPPLQ